MYMIADEAIISPPAAAPKPAKAGVSFYGLLLSAILAALFLALVVAGQPPLLPSLKFAFIVVFAFSHLSTLISLTFESPRRYSRFGISHTKKALNHILSVLLVALPFVSILIPVLVVPALLMLALSKYRSPDNVTTRLPFYKKDGFFEIANAILWIVSFLFILYLP